MKPKTKINELKSNNETRPNNRNNKLIWNRKQTNTINELTQKISKLKQIKQTSVIHKLTNRN